jgi:hypothetical protein
VLEQPAVRRRDSNASSIKDISGAGVAIVSKNSVKRTVVPAFRSAATENRDIQAATEAVVSPRSSSEENCRLLALKKTLVATSLKKLGGPIEKFVDLLYYSESKLCGGAVTVSFSKYLPWQAMHFLQRSTHFSKTCCRPLINSKFLTPELHFHGWKSPEIT